MRSSFASLYVFRLSLFVSRWSSSHGCTTARLPHTSPRFPRLAVVLFLVPPLFFPAPPLVQGKKALLSLFSISIMASKKIADAKLAKDFQAILKEFQKAQRLAAERETAYVHSFCSPGSSSFQLHNPGARHKLG
ncbi:hypothetical protein ACOSP7_014656 [Xanthoceras sorbifolium]